MSSHNANHPEWCSSRTDIASVLMRNAAQVNGWPPELRRPGNHNLTNLLEAALVLGGHAINRLTVVDAPSDRSDEAMVGLQLAAIAAAEAVARNDFPSAHNVLPDSVTDLRALAVTLAGLLAREVHRGNAGNEAAAFEALRQEFLANGGRANA